MARTKTTPSKKQIHMGDDTEENIEIPSETAGQRNMKPSKRRKSLNIDDSIHRKPPSKKVKKSSDRQIDSEVNVNQNKMVAIDEKTSSNVNKKKKDEKLRMEVEIDHQRDLIHETNGIKIPKYFLGCRSLAEFNEHSIYNFIQYFQKQKEGYWCALYSLNNAFNEPLFKKKELVKAAKQLKAQNPNIADSALGDLFDTKMGFFNIHVLEQTLKARYGFDALKIYKPGTTFGETSFPTRFIIYQKNIGEEVDHYFAIHKTFGNRWMLKDSLYERPFMMSDNFFNHMMSIWKKKENTSFIVHYIAQEIFEDDVNVYDLDQMRNMSETLLDDFCWVDRASHDDIELAQMYYIDDITLSGIDDGLICKYEDDIHIKHSSRSLQNHNEHTNPIHATDIDSDDSEIEVDLLDEYDWFNRQTGTSIGTHCNYILHPNQDCNASTLQACRPTSKKYLKRNGIWTEESLSRSLHSSKDIVKTNVSIGRIHAYLSQIAGKGNVEIEHIPRNDFRKIHEICDDGGTSCYYLVGGIYERFPDCKRQQDEKINYLSCTRTRRNQRFDKEFKGTVLVDPKINVLLCHFQRHSVSNSVVLRPFSVYLPINQNGELISEQNLGYAPYMRKILWMYKVEIKCKTEDMIDFGKK